MFIMIFRTAQQFPISTVFSPCHVYSRYHLRLCKVSNFLGRALTVSLLTRKVRLTCPLCKHLLLDTQKQWNIIFNIELSPIIWFMFGTNEPDR